MEALPLFLDRMVPELLAVMLSVSFVLIFGEVLPQAMIKKYGLAIGGNLAWFVRLLIILAYPVAFPASKLLDCMFGHDHATLLKRSELKELLNIHGSSHEGGVLTPEEVSVIKGALELKDKTVESITTPLSKVYMLDIDRRLDMETMDEILKTGHSRVPVYQNNNRQDIVGLLLIKNLIKLNPNDSITIRNIELREMLTVDSTKQLWELLNMFRKGKSHMALVKKEVPQSQEETDLNSTDKILLGIVTLEDVFEELIQEEIVDETDVYVDIQHQVRVADMFRRMYNNSYRTPGLLSKISSPIPSRSRNIFLAHSISPIVNGSYDSRRDSPNEASSLLMSFSK
jgi:metal transporter CNNM